jgi:excisionase family DNA binding protein
MLGNQAQAEETWLTFREVCDRLRMAPKTVRKLITSGDLEASRVGSAGIGGNGAYRISEEALASLMERRKVVPVAAAS